MKQITILLLSLLIIPSALFAKKDKTNSAFCQPIYIYGTSTSFNDSIVYLTDVQHLDSAYLEQDKFLGGIKDYTSQLDTYFFKQGTERISTVFFSTKQKKAEKKYLKLRKKLSKPKNHTLVKPITAQEFTFKNVRPDYDESNIPAPPVKDKKKKKGDRPQGGPDGKRPPMGGQGGPGGGMGGPGGGMGGGMGGPGGMGGHGM